MAPGVEPIFSQNRDPISSHTSSLTTNYANDMGNSVIISIKKKKTFVITKSVMQPPN